MKPEMISSSILAGVSISIGCIVFLQVGGVVGAILFSFGLITVVHYKLLLFTGTVGFYSVKEIPSLALILIGNLVGCAVVSLLAYVAHPQLIGQCVEIVHSRVSLSFWQVMIRAMGCGFIMTTAVCFARKGQYLPLLFGVPVFIMSGFIHCVADGFYLIAGMLSGSCGDIYGIVLLNYVAAVIGNSLGCNVYRALTQKVH